MPHSVFLQTLPNSNDLTRQIFGRDVDFSNVGTLLLNLVEDVFGSDGFSGPAWDFLFAAAAIVGLWRVFVGVRGLARLGDRGRVGGASADTTSEAIFANIIGGGALISIFAVMQTGTATVFGPVSPMAYAVSSDAAATSGTAINAIFRVVQWLGAFSVYRAFRIWQETASGRAQQGRGTPIVYLVSGIAAINLQRLLSILATSATT